MSFRSLSQTRPARLVLAALASVALSFSVGASTAAAAPGPNQTLIQLDPAISLGLKVAGVKLVNKGSATIGSAGIYYPVTNAVGVSDLFVGTTKHQGGFELQIGKSIKIGFRNMVIKTKAAVAGSPVTGEVFAEPTIQGKGLGVSLPVSDVTVDSVALKSPGLIAKYKLRLDKNIAKLINKTLGVSILTPGQPWATVETRLTRGAAAPGAGDADER